MKPRDASTVNAGVPLKVGKWLTDRNGKATFVLPNLITLKGKKGLL